jgi:hypothetical protein
MMQYLSERCRYCGLDGHSAHCDICGRANAGECLSCKPPPAPDTPVQWPAFQWPADMPKDHEFSGKPLGAITLPMYFPDTVDGACKAHKLAESCFGLDAMSHIALVVDGAAKTGYVYEVR